MYIEFDTNIVSTLHGYNISKDYKESIKDLISFDNLDSCSKILFSLRGGSYNVRKYDKEILSYFKKFSSFESLYVDLMLKGGSIIFGDSVKLKHWNFSLFNGIKFEDVEAFNSSWLTELGYECNYEVDNYGKYTYKNKYIVTKRIDVQSNKTVLSFNFTNPFCEEDLVGRIEIISGSACILALPFYMDGLGDFTTNIDGVNMFSVPQLIKMFFDLQTNQDVASSFITIKDEWYINELGDICNIVTEYNLAYKSFNQTFNVIGKEDKKYSEYLEQSTLLSSKQIEYRLENCFRTE